MHTIMIKRSEIIHYGMEYLKSMTKPMKRNKKIIKGNGYPDNFINDMIIRVEECYKIVNDVFNREADGHEACICRIFGEGHTNKEDYVPMVPDPSDGIDKALTTSTPRNKNDIVSMDLTSEYFYRQHVGDEYIMFAGCKAGSKCKRCRSKLIELKKVINKKDNDNGNGHCIKIRNDLIRMCDDVIDCVKETSSALNGYEDSNYGNRNKCSVVSCTCTIFSCMWSFIKKICCCCCCCCCCCDWCSLFSCGRSRYSRVNNESCNVLNEKKRQEFIERVESIESDIRNIKSSAMSWPIRKDCNYHGPI